MASLFEIPLSSRPQKFSITLSGSEYEMLLLWRNAQDAGWTLDIADTLGNPIIQGIPLVTGCNLLEQYDYLGFDGMLWVQTTADPDAVPTFDTIGSASHLYWYTA
jgi:hypothetical protein